MRAGCVQCPSRGSGQNKQEAGSTSRQAEIMSSRVCCSERSNAGCQGQNEGQRPKWQSRAQDNVGAGGTRVTCVHGLCTGLHLLPTCRHLLLVPILFAEADPTEHVSAARTSTDAIHNSASIWLIGLTGCDGTTHPSCCPGQSAHVTIAKMLMPSNAACSPALQGLVPAPLAACS